MMPEGQRPRETFQPAVGQLARCLPRVEGAVSVSHSALFPLPSLAAEALLGALVLAPLFDTEAVSGVLDICRVKA